MAGGEERLGTDSMYMATHNTRTPHHVNAIIHIYMGTYRCPKIRKNPAEART